MVAEGKVVKDCGVRVVRNGKTVHTGTIDSLRRVKEDVKEVSHKQLIIVWRTAQHDSLSTNNSQYYR